VSEQRAGEQVVEDEARAPLVEIEMTASFLNYLHQLKPHDQA